jgi:hypothetical protein
MKKTQFRSKCCGAKMADKSGYEYDKKLKEKLVFYCSNCGEECEMVEVEILKKKIKLGGKK